MIKAGKQIACCAVLLLVLCAVFRFTCFNSFSAYAQLMPGEEIKIRQDGVSVKEEDTDILRCGEPEIRDGYVRIDVHPENRGDSDVYLTAGNGETVSLRQFRVSRFHTVYDRNTGDFTGDTAVLITITLFWTLVSAIMLWHFFQAKGTVFYSYATIFYAGFFLFSAVTGLTMLRVTLDHALFPAQVPMFMAYSIINSASMQFMILTMPFILFFAVAMAVSNIALLRHERPRVQNALGLIVSFLLLAGEAVGWYLFSRDFMGSEWELRVNNTLANTYATVFVYFECMLAGSVICGVKAAKNEPAMDKDFIVILGCWFRKDGTLPPLLRGRVDKAVDFWRRQKEKTGKEAVFIPSGGQGKDESMPEAEAMRQYLLSRDIPDRLILPEAKSANTFQNMSFSRNIIQDRQPAGKTVFSTTNYHVFRSGVWAALAGLSAEGMGSKTKWWYWPNAFMRETVGLLKNRWKQETLFLIVLIMFFAALSLALGL